MGVVLPESVEELAKEGWMEEAQGQVYKWEQERLRIDASTNSRLPFFSPANLPPDTSFQHLFYISNLTHQSTLLRFLCGQHDLRVVFYQRGTKRRAAKSRRERVCRHGCEAVEDEGHLMSCRNEGVVKARELMMVEARKMGWMEESREEQEQDGNRWEEDVRADEDMFLLSSLIRHPKCFRIVSRFVHVSLSFFPYSSVLLPRT